MKFLRAKAIIVVIVVVSILCSGAAYIAVNTSITMYEKKSKILRNVPAKESKAIQSVGKLVNTNKFSDQVLFYNGKKVESFNAFLADNKMLFLPIDSILRNLGVKYSYFSSDDILETNLAGKKILIGVGKNSFSLGDKSVNLKTAPVAARDNILVPGEMFSYIGGFKVDGYADKHTAFMNNFPDYKPEAFQNIKVLRLQNATAYMSDIDRKKNLWDRHAGFSIDESYEASPDGSGYIIKSNGKVYMAKSGDAGEPRLIDVNPYARWSADGKYLYWVDEGKLTSYIYDIKNGSTKELGNYYLRIRDNEQYAYILYGGEVLYDYKDGGSYRRIAITNKSGDVNYTFIERKGKVIIEGEASYSPNKKKLLFKKSNGYYVANSDGTNIVFIGNNLETRWVNNSKIFVCTDKDMLVYDKNGTKKTKVDYEYRMLGQTPGGDIFFAKGSTLYCETNGVEKKIIDLPWECSKVYGLSAAGPYIAASSDKEDGVFYLTGKDIIKIGKYSLLLRGQKGENTYIDYGKSISISPDNGNIAVFQRENGFIKLYITDSRQITNETVAVGEKEILLSCPSTEASEQDTSPSKEEDASSKEDSISLKWISDSSMLVFTPQRGWIVDFKADTKIYEWDEQPGSSIKGILP